NHSDPSLRGRSLAGKRPSVSAFGSWGKLRDDGTHRLAGGRKSLTGIDDEIGTFALFAIRNLLGENGGELLFRHSGTCKDTLALNFRRRRDHHYLVDTAGSAGLEKKRNVENDQGSPVLPVLCHKPIRLGANQRMNDLLELSQGLRLAENRVREL